MSLFWIYKRAMTFGKPLILGLINQRLKNGKEDPDRLQERFGRPSRPRPESGPLMWVHVASVGEAQSMLHLISLFLDQNPTASVLVTSITRTSADLLQKRLPPRAFHQYLPVDRPTWVRKFLKHWRPDMVLWAESELWPSILAEIGTYRIPMALLNARMSPKSFRNWYKVKGFAQDILSAFTVILTQSATDATYYTQLGGRSVVPVGNIKFASPPLPYASTDLQALTSAIADRPVWLYASTHAGEEELAAAVHATLKDKIPHLLTIVAPRHPERGAAIQHMLATRHIKAECRGESKTLPAKDTDIYIADTLGELGLFYRLSPVSCIGRSFSHDGGGGHNPLEAAQLGSAVLHGPRVQNLLDIYTPMDAAGAAQTVPTADDLAPAVYRLLIQPEELKLLTEKGYNFAHSQEQILVRVIEELEPVFILANMPILKAAT